MFWKMGKFEIFIIQIPKAKFKEENIGLILFL